MRPKFLTESGLKVHLETSGSIIIPEKFAKVTYWIVCSPKGFNGANFNSPIQEVKILVSASRDLDRIKSWVRNFRNKVWVSIQPIEPDPLKYGNPDGLSAEQQTQIKLEYEKHLELHSAAWQANKAKAIEICKATGWQLSWQIHKYLRVR